MNSDISTLGLFTRNSPFIQARSYFGSKSHSSYLCEDLSKTQRNVIGWYYRFGKTTHTGSIFGVKVYYQNMIVVTVSLFRHVCIAVKSAYYLRHVLSSVLPYVSARLPMNVFPWNLIAGTSTRLRQENSNLVEIGQKYKGHIT